MADPEVLDPELEELFDSALEDWKKLDLTRAQSNGDRGSKEKNLPSFSSSSPAPSAATVQGLGMGLPDLNSRWKGKQKAAQSPQKKNSSYASEALEKLTQQTREAIRGLESAGLAEGPRADDGLDSEAMVEEFVKHFEGLAGSQDMESIVENMMQQLLSKEILQEPMKEIGARYPIWLEEHRSGLSHEDYERYSHQYELILQLNEVYEHDPNNFPKIVDLMQKMQECGQPPNDIVQELAPGFDLSNLGQLSPDLSGSPTNCCIM